MSFITGLLIVLGLFLNSRDQRTAATRSPLPSTQSELDKAQKQLGDLQNELSSLKSQALSNA
ncbi:MAG: hypothetical protein NTX25_02330, partial [Proteobacteria bacterium]|nr:hypothetical protein [Pseudomonadota bacterium]